MVAASCVMPLSANAACSPVRLSGAWACGTALALGISEVSDAVAVVVSEETGVISVVHGGRMIRRLDAERLENILRAFYRPLQQKRGMAGFIARLLPLSSRARKKKVNLHGDSFLTLVGEKPQRSLAGLYFGHGSMGFCIHLERPKPGAVAFAVASRAVAVGKDPGLQVMSTVPDTVRIRLSAPSTRWTSLLSDTRSVRAWVNLAGLQEGQHDLPVQIEVKDEIRPVRVISVDPDTIEVTLEPVVVEPISITLMIDGEPALGYQADRPNFSPETVVVSAPRRWLSRFKKCRAISIAGSRQSVETTIQLTALDRGATRSRVTLTPDSIDVTLPVNLQGGYRNVIVKVNVVGYVADGYKLHEYHRSSPTVTVFSSDPTLTSCQATWRPLKSSTSAGHLMISKPISTCSCQRHR